MTSIKDALEPFARIPLAHTDDIDDGATVFEYEGGSITLGDLRRVNEALATLTTPTPGRDALRERIARLQRDILMYIDAGCPDDDIGYIVKVSHINLVQWYDALDAILSALPVAPVWQTIDQAPKDGRYLIVAWFKQDELKWAKQSRWLTAQDAAELNGGLVEDFEGGWTDGDDEYDYCSPTHFMPLPAPGDKTMPVAPVVDGWCNADDIPPVPKGQMREYVVAVKRAKTGKAYEFAACYLNGYPIEYRDCCPKGDGCDGDGCDDGCPTTGWFEQTGDDYYDTMFNQMSIGKDDTFLGWRELPRWEDRATAPVVDEAAIRADEREKCALIVERWSLPTIQTPSMWLVDKQGIAAEIRAGGGER